jgi:hypothetical protein
VQVFYQASHGFVQVENLETGSIHRKFVSRSGHATELNTSMEEKDKKQADFENIPAEERPDFIQEFIDRKRLQNKVLQDIIDKINHEEENPNQK